MKDVKNARVKSSTTQGQTLSMFPMVKEVHAKSRQETGYAIMEKETFGKKEKDSWSSQEELAVEKL